MKISFTKKEISNLLLSALILGIVFGFDDGRAVFIPRLWFANYMLMSSLSLVALTVMVLSHKWAAGRYNMNAEYSIWNISRFGFRDYQYIHKNKFINKIPLGIILPLIVAIFTEGKMWFAAVGMMLTSTKSEHRMGRKWIHAPEYEEARTAFAGPMATMIFMILLGLFFENTGTDVWKTLIFINMILLLSNMLPFPHLAGGRMLYTSFYLFIFCLALAAGISILLLFIPTIPALVSALFLAIVTVIAVFFKREV